MCQRKFETLDKSTANTVNCADTTRLHLRRVMCPHKFETFDLLKNNQSEGTQTNDQPSTRQADSPSLVLRPDEAHMFEIGRGRHDSLPLGDPYLTQR